jgi:hypothetical protein
MLLNGFNLNKSLLPTNKRAGVIPYTVFQGRLFFLLGVDRKTNEYTDFGGGCKNNETLLDGAWREFQEETCGVFSMFDKSCLTTSIAVCNETKDSAIFFVEVPYVLLDIAPPLFMNIQKENILNKKCLENVSIQWIDDEDFRDMAFKNSKLMWVRINKFLSEHTEWDDLKMKIVLRRAITIPEKRGCYGVTSVNYPYDISLSLSLSSMYEKYYLKHVKGSHVIKSIG